MTARRSVVIAKRPAPGEPRPYAFPEFSRTVLDNGLGVISVHLPGRPLVAASLVITSGAADEPDELAGGTVLMARALTEGTERYDAIELVEATERLGASLHAEAGWDSASVSVDVPADRLPAALDLVEEVLARPTFPVGEVERLRDERLNDLLQAKADPRRRAEEAFVAAVYAGTSPYRRPAAGTGETVARLDAETSRSALAARFDPARMTLVVGGDLAALDVAELAAARFGRWGASAASAQQRETDASPAATSRRVLVVHRPGSVQTEIRIGHPGVPRRIPEFHAVSVMSAVLGGLFNSRLNRKLREEKGYTYGAGAGFDPRRAAGPFAARAAVNTDVTVPAVLEIIAELEAIRADVAESELGEARDYLAGVFPLRFETAGAVVGALSGIVVQGLPDDELTRYRPAILAVTRDDALAAARAHVRPHEAAIVLVGDADAFLPALLAAGIGPIEVDRDTPPSGSSGSSGSAAPGPGGAKGEATDGRAG
ncbi:MAG TPA: pitrilysin family protein [Candidatus Sulfomarinibacteraceae bacterium]|nr:pitrilysin family protein [Candidatus Sulfomarinibacteraceae bacterium]